MRTLLDRMPLGVAVARGDRLLHVNPRLREILGYGRGEPVEGLALADLVATEDFAAFAEALRRASAGFDAGERLFRARRRDGTPIEMDVRAWPAALDGHPAVFLSFLDLTPHRAAMSEALARGRRYEALFHGCEVFIWDQDLSALWLALEQLRQRGIGDIARHLRETPGRAEELAGLVRLNECNEAGAKLFDALDDTWVPGSAALPRALEPILREQIAALWDGRPVLRSEVALPVPGGGSLFGALSMRMPQSAAAARHSAVVLFDITERKAAEARLAYLARFDSLTDLPNRATFIERLREAMARARRGGTGVAIHFLDLDRFKDVNDTLGHAAGDALLQAVAQRLKSSVRTTDTVARFGGDEFAVIQTDIGEPAGIDLLASKLIQALGQPYPIAGRELTITTSIGITLFSPQVRDPEAMMAHADLALYRAKEEGRNRYKFHSPEMDREARARLLLAGQLRQAIEGDRLALFYQPQVEMPGGRIIGLEALLRWRRGAEELLRPVSFLRIAEEMGLVVPLGHWVLREACRQLRAWTETGIAPPRLALNVSARQLRGESDFEPLLRGALEEFGVAPSRIELELTEAALAETARGGEDLIEELRRIGVAVAIDAFGTGYSSLGYLTAFRFSRLKIARHFVHDILSNAGNLAIVRAILRLAEELELRTIAQGVETFAQAQMLASLGCREMQGFCFGRPMPAAAIEPLLRAGRVETGPEPGINQPPG